MISKTQKQILKIIILLFLIILSINIVYSITASPNRPILDTSNPIPNIQLVSDETGLWANNNMVYSSVYIWSSTKNTTDFQELEKIGIKNIFLHEEVFIQASKSNTSQQELKKWLKEANQHNIKVHIWLNCFHTTNGWIHPHTNEGNLRKKEVLANIVKYLDFYQPYVHGIHLDYLRYQKNAFNTPGGYENAANNITDFTKQVKFTIKNINGSIIISGALMIDEVNNNKQDGYYYGQDYSEMAKYLDVIVPMIYTDSPEFIKHTIFNISQDVTGTGVQIWPAIATYSVENNTFLDYNHLDSSIQACLAGGSQGYVLFREALISDEVKNSNGFITMRNLNFFERLIA